MFRIVGEMVESEHDTLTPSAAKELLYELFSPAQRQRIEEQLDLDFGYEIEGLARFRANILHQQRGLGGVFRLIPSKILFFHSQSITASLSVAPLCLSSHCASRAMQAT